MPDSFWRAVDVWVFDGSGAGVIPVSASKRTPTRIGTQQETGETAGAASSWTTLLPSASSRTF